MKRVLILLLIVVISFSGCNMFQNNNANGVNQNNTNDTNDIAEVDMIEREIVLYFADSQGQFVVPESRTVKVNKDINATDFGRIVLEELIKGPKKEELYRTIPSEVKVLNIEIKGDTMFVDFSNEMHTKHWGGATGEDMTISSLVNTMTELEGIKKLLPSVEGMALNIEHMIIDEPLERMDDKIYK